MKKNIKMFILIFIILLSSSVISGCWNYREINDFLIVTGAAIDKSEDNDDYIISIETISPKGGENVEMESAIYSATGKTIFDAIRNSIQISGKKTYWSHAKVIVISKDIAKEGISPILDFFNRSIEIRSDIFLLISLDETAKKILESKDTVHNTASYHLEEMLNSEKSIPKYHSVELYEFKDSLSCKIQSPIAPTTKAIDINGMKAPTIFGTAVFRKNKMVGWLNEYDTTNMIIIKGEDFDGGIILIENALDTNTNISLEVFDSKTKVSTDIIEDNIIINIDVKMNVEISEIAQYGEKVDFLSKKGRKEFEKYAEELIKTRLESTINKVQREYKTDVFGFGRKVKINHPDEFKKMINNWDEIFSNLQVSVNVDLTIQGSSLTSYPINSN